MTVKNFQLKKFKKSTDFYSVESQAPSNIALIKYWGKQGLQLPKNPSISFTLSNCRTNTKINFTRKQRPSTQINFDVFHKGKPALGFKPKITQFFERISEYVPFIFDYEMEIHTSNSFPHSSGIASSASGMAALTACLIEFEKQVSMENKTEGYYKQKTSFLARLGSGSASRSVAGPLMLWGKHKDFKQSSDDFAIALDASIHPVFKTYQDTILLVDRGQKKVSSSAGHNLMNGHPFAAQRFEQAKTRISQLRDILKNANLDEFIKLVESEALTLHAMMMTSDPYYLLMKADTVNVIERIWHFREETGSKICFTLDAGANVHLLYPKAEKEKVKIFIDQELTQFCQEKAYIHDEVGGGVEV